MVLFIVGSYGSYSIVSNTVFDFGRFSSSYEHLKEEETPPNIDNTQVSN